MYELLTPAQMARADALAIAGGTPGIELMNKAGLAVADSIASRHKLGTKISVVCGPGNNGGDGFVAARILKQRGYSVRLALLGDPDRISGDARLALEQCPVPVELWSPDLIAWSRCIIDALFGAGLDRPITGEAADLINRMNASDADITSVDLPSGISGLDGAVKGIAVRAHQSVTFFRKKPGHCLMPGKSHCGTVRVVDIGIPDAVLDEIKPQVCENGRDLWRRFWSPPLAGGHKFARGHCIAVSGPVQSTGAIRLAARAALRTGAGLVTIATPPDALAVNAAHSTAVMTRPFDGAAGLRDVLADKRISSIVMGPGFGLGADNRACVLTALACEAFVVLDADALTLFAEDGADLFRAIASRPPDRTVLTPHDGEFARLFPEIAGEADQSKIDRCLAAARASGAVVILKGADTVIASPDGRGVVNHEASPWLATAGSGDVLAGILAGLGAQSTPGVEASSMAVFIHCAAADHAGAGLIAEDLVEAIKPVIADFDRDYRS